MSLGLVAFAVAVFVGALALAGAAVWALSRTSLGRDAAAELPEQPVEPRGFPMDSSGMHNESR